MSGAPPSCQNWAVIKEHAVTRPGHRLENGQGASGGEDRKTRSDRWERQMSYLENVINDRPMLRAAASVIIAFCFAAPLVWLFSNLVVYGLRSVL